MVSPFLIDIWHEISSISSLCNVVTGQLDQVSEIRVVLMVIKLLLKLGTRLQTNARFGTRHES